MTKEEVGSIIQYCKENGVTYKARLAELGIPAWRFYDSKAHYVKEQEVTGPGIGEFLQLTTGGDFVPMPSFSATTGRGFSKKKDNTSKMLSIELRTPNGTLMRIQGELSCEHLQSIIQTSSSHV